MAYSGSDLLQEIRGIISEKIEHGEPVPASWLATEVAARHGKITGEDADFHFFCTRHYVREQVTKALKHYKPTLSPKDDPQLVLPGYECLQHAYSVLRDGEDLLLPVDNISDEEMLSKADELEAMAKGAVKHAAEIRRYVSKRRSLRVG